MTSLADRLPELRAFASTEREMARLELVQRAANAELRARLETDWEAWLQELFPSYVPLDFAPHHREFWAWVWSINDGVAADAYIAVWDRGGAKSTNLELATAALAARHCRRYGVIVSDTQDQANDRVGDVAVMLESERFAELYPEAADRAVGKFGNPKGWRRNRLRTASGFTLDAIGLDSAARGAKIDEDRPDWLLFDDLDDGTDSVAVTDRKLNDLTRKLLPARADHAAVAGVQNLVLPNGIFARLCGVGTERADFLVHRTVSGPIPTVRGLVLDHNVRADGSAVIVAGEPSWPARGIERAQATMDDVGETAFLIECQHQVELRGGGMFDHLEYAHCEPDEVPDLTEITIWCDPAVTDTDRSDSMAVQCDGIDATGTIYRLRSWEQRSSPETAIGLAIVWAYELGALTVGIETDQGGDTWRSVFARSLETVLATHPEWVGKRKPRFESDKAGAGHGPKTERAARMLADYERPGRNIVHVITKPGVAILGDSDLAESVVPYPAGHTVLEAALGRFPRVKPLDLTDAAFWGWNWLRERFGTDAGTSAAVTATMPPLRR